MFFGKDIVKNALQVSSWEKLCIIIKNESEVAQSCPTLCDPMDYSLPGSSIHWISQARILEQIVISFSRGSSRPGIKPMSPALAGESFTTESPRKPLLLLKRALSPSRGLIAFVLGPLSFSFLLFTYLYI